MKISRDWLQAFFEKPLPDAPALADALTFHAFEIESVENDVLDVKVTPNRGHDCLCHRGIAKELSAILNVPMKKDDLREKVELGPKTDAVTVEIKEPELCLRYIAGYIKGVKVGPSPDWLQKRLSSIGQRPINNIVDATNYVMFTLGQPLHAFDASKLKKHDSRFTIQVRKTKAGEEITTLDNKEYELSESNLLIVDGNSDRPIGIAGVKGGLPASITEETTDIIIESATFDGVSIRKTAKALHLRTDASVRYEQVISPELAAFGMKAVAELIVQVAGGERIGFHDLYVSVPKKHQVHVSLEKINDILGIELTADQVVDVLRRLDLEHELQGETFTVHVPFERLDLTIPEDIAEEVGRIIGYDKIEPQSLSPFSRRADINQNFAAAEAAREELVANGYSEVVTSVFAEKGERVVANKVDGVRPYLRTNLADGLRDAMDKNLVNKDVLAIDKVKIFEIGTIWKDGFEKVHIAKLAEQGKKKGQYIFEGNEVELKPAIAAETYADLPLSTAIHYEPFSKYPFIARDIAMWVPEGVTEKKVLEIITHHAGDLLVKSYLFDRFEKDGKRSLAFRLIFQSFDKTLTDFDANERMESISSALQLLGCTIR